MAAVMAGQQAVGAVHDERDVARRAAPRLPARAAGQEVRPAAPVEQDDRLARRRVERLVRARDAARGAPRACRRPRPAAAGPVDARAAGAGAPARGRTPGAGSRCRPRGRRRPARRGARPRGARRSAGRPRACRTRRAPRRPRPAPARASGRRRPSAGRRTTRASPARRRAHSSWRSPGRELRVQDGDRVAEARDEARHDLRGQRDLGDEHDHPAAVREGLGGGPQVDLGLAGPGDAVQQQPLARRGGDDRAQRRGLVGGQLRLLARGADGDVQRRAAHDARGDLDEPARLQAAQRGEVAAGEARQRREQRALAVAEARRAPRRRRSLGARWRAHRAVFGPRALRRQQERERARRRRAVLGRHPQREVHQLGRQPRLEHAARRDRVVLGARRPAR